jgi:hypothetical protein
MRRADHAAFTQHGHRFGARRPSKDVVYRGPSWHLRTTSISADLERIALLVEKDRACLDRSDEENEDTFVNPRTRFGIQLTLGGLAWCGTSRFPDSQCRRADVS